MRRMLACRVDEVLLLLRCCQYVRLLLHQAQQGSIQAVHAALL